MNSTQPTASLLSAKDWAHQATTSDGLLITNLSALIGQTGNALALSAGRILAIGDSAALQKNHSNLKTVDGTGFTAMPGLINAHVHAPMGFFRGLGHGRDQMIESFLFPAEKALTPELLAPLSYSYLLAGLRSGTTCFGEHYYFVAGVATAMDQLGLRGVVGETVADLGGAFPGTSGWIQWQKTIKKWPFSTRVQAAIAPHAADTVSPSLLKELAAVAKAEDLPLHMHLSQSRGERERVEKREGKSPVAYAQACGALGPKTLAVHLTSIDDTDAQILGASGATAGYCPASQMIFEKLAPIATLTRHGVPLALGTDCAASNDGADMLSEMKLAGLLARDRGLPEAACEAAAIFAAGTINGARAFGLDQKIGSLTPGKAADIVFLADDLEVLPQARPLNNIIFSASPRQVRHVLIDGRFVLIDGEPQLIAEATLRADYLAAVAAIKGRLGF